MSKVQHADGSVGHFPHIIDRAKPGAIGVLADGKRFVNEADGYHDYIVEDGGRRSARPGGGFLAHLRPSVPASLRSRFLEALPAAGHALPSQRLSEARGATLEVAAACGIAPQTLAETARSFNEHARRGEDPAFGRGSTPYNRKQGDPLHKPNPCVAPIERGPFYAVKVPPASSFGTFAG